MHKTLQEAACRTIRAQSSGGASGKVRRLNSGSRSSVMATSDGGGGERGRRKRRAWRQPRHEPGSPPVATSVTATTTEPRASASRAVDTASTIVGSAARTAATDTSQSLASGARSPCSLTAGETKGLTKEEERQRDDGAAQLLPEPSNAGGERLQDSVVEIDGSAMEGGGQVLRNVVTLGCLVRRAVRVIRVRGGRSKPGLRPQHLAGLRLIGQLCGGKLAGDDVNSTRVEFWPGSVRNGDYSADTQTAGSVTVKKTEEFFAKRQKFMSRSTTLLLQVSLPCLLFAPPTSSSTLTLRGGTNADMAPPIDYITKVFKPTVGKFGITFDCKLKKRGFYPRGGGEVVVKPHPLVNITPATITEPGQVVSVSIHSFVAGTAPEKIAQQMAQAARQQVAKQLPGVAIETKVVCETANTAFGNGLWHYCGG
ncbi:RNA 3'-terminal phosphate cyclase [Geodia barretti]|uniref:RNA 3'-terminal phosphate cyclase n=1 Tax=Geodia barretti TaxID=519541 RepID=A0AA35T0X1_GEOBA|nr:RNA 3'-terminal phosphate cyclase [Geodia barretti]